MFAIALWIVVGALVGGGVRLAQRSDRRWGVLFDVGLGVTGAVAGGLTSRLLGFSSADLASNLAVNAMVLTAVGALAAIGVAQLAWRRRAAKG